MFNFLRKKKILNQRIIGINQRNVELIYHFNNRKDYKLADDKVLTKTILHDNQIDCAETYAVIERIGDIYSAWASVQHHETLAIKPANGSGGGGIKILKKNQDGQWMSSGKAIRDEEVFQHLATIIMGIYSLGGKDRVLIERCIEPHPFFHEIYPAGVPDFRVILLNNIPLLSMLRVPTDRSDGKANLHQGGLGIGIDMATGKLTQGYDGSHYHDIHPDSKSIIKGKDIPYWDELLQLSIETSKAFPLNYLGVDIVLDKDAGPMIMEVNVRPGLGIQLVNKTGLKEVIQGNTAFQGVLQ
jgi:alpha-L-glutamate ligase-like protein